MTGPHAIGAKVRISQGLPPGHVRTPLFLRGRTGEVIRQTPLANAAEVRAAVENSKEAFATWSHTPPARRAQVMFKYRDLLIKNIQLKI